MKASYPPPTQTRLQQARIERNWRQHDVADQLGTTIVTIRRWERGSHQPSPYYRIKLCTLFGMSLQELGLVADAPNEESNDTPNDVPKEEHLPDSPLAHDPVALSAASPSILDAPLANPEEGQDAIPPASLTLLTSPASQVFSWARQRVWIRMLAGMVLLALVLGGLLMAIDAGRNHATTIISTTPSTNSSRIAPTSGITPHSTLNAGSSRTATTPVITPQSTPNTASSGTTSTSGNDPQSTGNSGTTTTASSRTAPTSGFDPQSTVDPYGTYNTVALSDDLTGTTSSSQWDVSPSGKALGCFFRNQTYDMSSQGLNYCALNNPNFGNFAYQIQLKIVQGHAAGIIFRTDESAAQTYYIFEITVDGTFFVQRNDSSEDSTLLSEGNSAAIKTGFNQPNSLAVDVNGGQMTFYINGRVITQLTDSHYSSGLIGVIVGTQTDTQAITEATYNYARVWV